MKIKRFGRHYFQHTEYAAIYFWVEYIMSRNREFAPQFYDVNIRNVWDTGVYFLHVREDL